MLIGKIVGLILIEWQVVKLFHQLKNKNLTQIHHNSFLKPKKEESNFPTVRHKNVTMDLRERQSQVCLLVDS